MPLNAGMSNWDRMNHLVVQDNKQEAKDERYEA
jgi:hypothetical protein